MERGADDGGEVDVLRPRGRRYRREEGEGEAGGPERHSMRRRRSPEAKPEPVAPPEKYYPTAGRRGDGGTREERRRQDREGPRQEEETADGQGLVVRRSMQMAENSKPAPWTAPNTTW